MYNLRFDGRVHFASMCEDVRVHRIYGGASEIMKEPIARALR